MISWMQKHRKYLVVTIWISTIAFVGAGFVGWGTYQYGSMSNNVAKVGDVKISVESYQRAYSDTFERYNRMLGGRLDEATAKQLGLRQQVLQSLIYQALVENFAREHGIIVSDAEVQQAIYAIPAFQKDGKFDKQTYISILGNMRLKPKAFEEGLKKDLLLQKTLSLLSPDSVPLETEAVGAALFMADKVRFRIVPADSVEVEVSEEALKSFWEKHRNDYMTPKTFTLSMLWIEPSSDPVSDEDLKAYYTEHRADFMDEKGQIRSLEAARDDVEKAVRLHRSKKSAQLAYIDLKKGRREAPESQTLTLGDVALTPEAWQKIDNAMPGSTLKPMVVNGRYLVVKVEKINLPRPKSFEEAREEARKAYLSQARAKALMAKAREIAKNLTDGTVTSFLTRDSTGDLAPLSEAEAKRFLEALFGSDKPYGAVLLDDKAVAYRILEQKLLDDDKLSQYDSIVKDNAKKIKSSLLQNGLIERLQQRYPIEIFLKDSE